MHPASQSFPPSFYSCVRRSVTSATTTAMTTAILAVSVALPATAIAEPETTLDAVGDVAASTVDLFVLRPLSICRLLVGFSVLMPMSSLMNVMVLPIAQDTTVFREDWDRLVVEPKEYTFDRAIGEDLVGG